MFNGFNDNDFDVFKIEGLDERMKQLIALIRPKLEDLGKEYSAELTSLTGEEMHFHVAKHARRTVNPPKDTWVAFAPNKRGYKMLPHFQIGLFETHVFIWYAVIYEAPMKEALSSKMLKSLPVIKKKIPSDFVWSPDHMKPDAVPHSQLKKSGLEELVQRLGNVKKAELLCGVHVPREKAVKMDKSEWQSLLSDTFAKLMPLYEINKQL
ncbi:YktB family protein [Fictibacillus aquaticus]|uniref:UPF0637 protein CGZ90_03595 n=1 Tax=Fictibacillus aquaticus TaxID=2021314 RepID=A0A235FCF0_9BACL|nr:DUF1054 domain-containing protein [Fictibacillus aquaticus]OYD58996.1 hypothetical protein CGZ90_03595 [Fictibacillus aquaticus]